MRPAFRASAEMICFSALLHLNLIRDVFIVCVFKVYGFRVHLCTAENGVIASPTEGRGKSSLRPLVATN
ncbi:MAG: hypothetical protein DBY04_07845 [Clostridiales bacterium]|nr:MAG: hypothetical protein DBY04_07845 [Clostridiales bacterium]